MLSIGRFYAPSSFQSNSLAAAMGFDRANYILGLGGLSGNVSTSYLQSIESAVSSPQGGGTYEGFQISQRELTSAFSALSDPTGTSERYGVDRLGKTE